MRRMTPSPPLTQRHPYHSLAMLVLTTVFVSSVQAAHHEAAADEVRTEFPNPLPVETIPAVESIATPYPPHYAVVHDTSFGSLVDSAMSVVDTKTRRYLGMISAGNFATLQLSAARQELYVGETYFSRGTRGERTDLLSIYDMANLERLAEIELPKKRANIVVNKSATALTSSGKFMLVLNLNPGTSVSVVDLDSRTFVGELSTPGCAMIYPTRDHNFFMLCGDGSLLAINLDGAGQETKRTRSKPFIDIDNDPLSEKSSKVGADWYFVSFLGDVQPILNNRRGPKIAKRWSVTSDAERAENWRPAGWHWTAGHPADRLWVGMTPNGYDGSHKDPASEVWLFNTKSKQRLQRFALQTPALSIDVTLADSPQLLVVNIEGALDVYDATSGDYLRSIYDLGTTPFQVHRIQ